MLFDSLYDAFIVLLGILLLCAAHALHIAQALHVAVGPSFVAAAHVARTCVCRV